MNLQHIRKQMGLTQRQVADHIGCAPGVYSRYETGDREPSISILIQLSGFLGVSIDAIVGNEFVMKDNDLNSYEAALVNAAREADDRAREDALSILVSHNVTKKKDNLE